MWFSVIKRTNLSLLVHFKQLSTRWCYLPRFDTKRCQIRWLKARVFWYIESVTISGLTLTYSVLMWPSWDSFIKCLLGTPMYARTRDCWDHPGTQAMTSWGNFTPRLVKIPPIFHNYCHSYSIIGPSSPVNMCSLILVKTNLNMSCEVKPVTCIQLLLSLNRFDVTQCKGRCAHKYIYCC